MRSDELPTKLQRVFSPGLSGENPVSKSTHRLGSLSRPFVGDGGVQHFLCPSDDFSTEGDLWAMRVI